MTKLNENKLTEQPVIEWFKSLGYEYRFGPDISTGGITVERDYKDVILEKRLRNAIKRLNPELEEKEIDEAVYKFKNIDYPNLEISNREVYKMLRDGIKIEVNDKNKDLRGKFVKVIDFETPENNEFLVVNQFTIQGSEKVRRPDIVVFINGIPVAIFELKNPGIEEATIQTAYLQLQEYKKDIPEIFKYNQIMVISDLIEAKYGTISSNWEWFKKWRGIDNPDEKLKGVSELKVLVKGIFQKVRFLDIIKNFIVFEADSEKDVSKYTKKICLYHQYFGINKAVQKTIEAMKPKGDGRIGVLWHTQGSGKTLSMVFYVNKAKEITELKSPTFVFLTDRNDLDNQFYKTFLRTEYANLAKQAESRDDLKEKLRNAGSEIIFTTIQKFKEISEVLSQKENIIVIADEAHRSEYAELAARVRNALPNASFMGITATPIDLKNRSTRIVFGDYIDKYPMSRSVEDGTTVPIYYESRLVPLHLTNEFIDEDFNELTQEVEDPDIKESLKRKITKIEKLISVPDRLQEIAQDIISHFNSRDIKGKAMIVTVSRSVAVEMYKLIKKIKDSPDVAVVISKPEEFKDDIQGEIDIQEIEKKFKDPDDPLKIVIVCDMWLTGFDVPHLTTMYFDKPIKNHSLMQAIARVNRIFKDKYGGLIVDYIGITDDLKKALNIYDNQTRKEIMIPLGEITKKMLEKYKIVKSIFEDVDFSNWKYLEEEDLSHLFQKALNAVMTDLKTGYFSKEKKEKFLKESFILIKLHSFVMPHKEAYYIKNEVEFIKKIRAVLIKRTVVKPGISNIDLDVISKELLNKSIEAEGVIDIFHIKGKEKLDISILDEKFMEEVKKIKYKNLAVEILRKLLEDEIKVRIIKNRIRYNSLLELLEKVIEEYEDRIIDSSKIIKKLVEIAKEIRKIDKEVMEIGLTEEEVVFYDALLQEKIRKNDDELKKLVKELVKIIRRDLTIDWTNNEIIKAKIMANVKRLLLINEFKPEETDEIAKLIYQQAEILYKDYSLSQFPYLAT